MEQRQNHSPPGSALHSGKAGEILDVRKEIESKQTRKAAFIERIGNFMARPAFFAAVAVLHAGWILLNLPLYPWFQPWDPYPFTFLATIASAEAPFITLLILMRQRRESRIAELREEMHLQLSLHIEREVTMALRLLRETQQNLHLTTSQDPEITAELLQDLDPEKLLETLRDHLRQTEGADATTTP